VRSPVPTKRKKRDVEIATLKRKLMETEAQLAHVYHFVNASIDKANKQRLMASGVLVRLNFLGGEEVCIPFVIKGGLSDATIQALKQDCRESYESAVEFKPAPARQFKPTPVPPGKPS
jgi:hypothetical protein